MKTLKKKRIPWNKGKKIQYSEEALRKMSSIGKHWRWKHPMSIEDRRRRSEERKGRPHNGFGFKKGCTPWNKGKKGVYSEEVRKKMSVATKGKRRPKFIPWNKGETGIYSKALRMQMGQAQKGKKHWNWKGGITNIMTKIRLSPKYMGWRQSCFIRDAFTCQECGDNTGMNLRAHHIKPFKKLLQEVKKYMPLINLFDATMLYTPIWNIDNGITLCEECHKKKHKRKRIRRKNGDLSKM